MAIHISVPEARNRLRALAEKHSLPELQEIADGLYRKKAKSRRAPTKSAPMSPVLALKIRTYAANHPSASNQEIANMFDVNPGRVTDALNHVY